MAASFEVHGPHGKAQGFHGGRHGSESQLETQLCLKLAACAMLCLIRRTFALQGSMVQLFGKCTAMHLQEGCRQKLIPGAPC